ncbi:hypothetical protein BCR32DRAFT_282492 [Anaeromyces robustus]|uniref:Uncharacterized protein n=1 Tax=Anaeromyces robustus TaxID=1754192 RepID=A0A1Y1WY21_9FUNG|nr:hypothetical protein BCR32DRAFT_282492 [Anaeromyces robustus]|eukprot:ORX78218.1 hypothetical protein BCR32DRAFT_282492 [Anaeromyces robustus]
MDYKFENDIHCRFNHFKGKVNDEKKNGNVMKIYENNSFTIKTYHYYFLDTVIDSHDLTFKVQYCECSLSDGHCSVALESSSSGKFYRLIVLFKLMNTQLQGMTFGDLFNYAKKIKDMPNYHYCNVVNTLFFSPHHKQYIKEKNVEILEKWPTYSNVKSIVKSSQRFPLIYTFNAAYGKYKDDKNGRKDGAFPIGSFEIQQVVSCRSKDSYFYSDVKREVFKRNDNDNYYYEPDCTWNTGKS